MRYVTATIGAIFIFVAVVVIGTVTNSFLPPAFQQPVTILTGVFGIGGTPALLIGIGLGSLAAIHSFRSTHSRDAMTTK
jgi:hypothetical protein